MSYSLSQEHQPIRRSEVIQRHQLHQQTWSEGKRCSEQQSEGSGDGSQDPVAGGSWWYTGDCYPAEDEADGVKVAY